VPVAEGVQAQVLLDVLEAVQVGERQAGDLARGSAVFPDQVVVQAAVADGDGVTDVDDCRDTGLDAERTP
jgi:hypothetical protein